MGDLPVSSQDGRVKPIMPSSTTALTTLLFAHLISTTYMTGLIWFVQIVHYPLFREIGRETFVTYEKCNQNLTTFVVGPPMIVEILSTLALLWLKPDSVDSRLLWAGFMLLMATTCTTAFVSVPLHERLSAGFDAVAHWRLVQTNWIRTVAWTGRCAIACLIIYQALKGSGSSN